MWKLLLSKFIIYHVGLKIFLKIPPHNTTPFLCIFQRKANSAKLNISLPLYANVIIHFLLFTTALQTLHSGYFFGVNIEYGPVELELLRINSEMLFHNPSYSNAAVV